MAEIKVDWGTDVDIPTDDAPTLEDMLLDACQQARKQMLEPEHRPVFECTTPNGDRFLVDFFGALDEVPAISEIGIPEEDTSHTYLIAMELSTFIDHDLEGILDLMAEICGHPLMTDIHYEVVGHEEDVILLHVTGDIKLSLEARALDLNTAGTLSGRMPTRGPNEANRPHGEALAALEEQAGLRGGFPAGEAAVFAHITKDNDCDDGKRHNENCLKGFKCPDCGWTESFDIAAECTVIVKDDGTDDPRDFHWGDAAHCQCVSCGCCGTVGDFHGGKNKYPQGLLAHEIAQFLERNNLEAEHLDGAVDQQKSSERANINNGGLDEQVSYLVESGWTEAEILSAAELDAGLPPLTLLVRCLRCEKNVSRRTAHLVNKDKVPGYWTNHWCCDDCWDERLR
jgi:hypothetical protein